MNGTAAGNLQVNPDLMASAEKILSGLGLSLSRAVNMFMQQVIATGRMPIETDLPPVPDSINADKMTKEELWGKIKHSLEQAERGELVDAAVVFAKWREEHRLEAV